MKQVHTRTLSKPQNAPLEVYLGGQLLAIRTQRHVMATPLIKSIDCKFHGEDLSFGFTRALLLEGHENPNGIMLDIIEGCIKHVYSNPEVFFHVRDHVGMHLFTFEHLMGILREGLSDRRPPVRAT